MFPNGIIKNPHVCPRCGGETRRAHRRSLWDRVISGLARLFPFRCHECGNRFYDWR